MNISSAPENARRPKTKRPLSITPAKIVLTFSVLGGVWILFSGMLLNALTSNTRTIFYVETAKGWIFIGGISCLLYFLIKKSNSAIRRSEAELAESNDRYKLLIEQSAAGIVVIDQKGQIIEANPTALEISGYSAKEAPTLNIRDLCPDAERENAQFRFAEVLRGETVVSRRTLYRKDGSTVKVESSSRILSDGTIQSVVRDITDRADFEKALLQSEERWRELIENAYDLIYTRSLDGHFISVNKACETTTGFGRQELLASHVLDLVAPEYRELTGQLLLDRPSEGRTFRGFEIITKQNQRVALEVSERPIYENGRLFAIQGIARDVTERLRAESTLQETKEWLAAIFEASQDAIVVERDECIVFANNRYLDSHGYASAAEVIGRPVSDFQSKPDSARMLEYSRMRARGEAAPTVYEFCGIRKDGSEIELEATVSSFESNGEFFIVTALKDIRERKAAEKTLREREEELRQAQKMEAVGRLAGGIAHDFNNILTAINGYSDLLMRQVEAQSARAKVREIRLAADRATSLTKQLLAFSRKQILQPKILNLNTVVSDVYSMLQPVIGEHIELVLSLSPSLASVMVDPGQLSQVILNLAVNARDAMPEGGTLTVETRNIRLDEAFCRSHTPVEPGDYVMLSITDTGIGMDAATQNRVFEPFFTTKERGKGTGLGLSTVYGIVKQSGGYIRLESAVHKGTSFKIYLPTVQDQEKPATAESQEPVPLSTGKGTILLVEDEEVVRSLGREVLELCGYKVLEASNGAQALRASVEHVGRIDLLLTDVVMPGMSGVDLAEKLSKDIPNLKILYTSGYTDGAPLGRINWNDHEQFLQKPFTPETLAMKVGEVMAT